MVQEYDEQVKTLTCSSIRHNGPTNGSIVDRKNKSTECEWVTNIQCFFINYKEFTAFVMRDTFLAAVFLWKIPFEAALEISAIATGRAA